VNLRAHMRAHVFAFGPAGRVLGRRNRWRAEWPNEQPRTPRVPLNWHHEIVIHE
jgi:hypothetical protein